MTDAVLVTIDAPELSVLDESRAAVIRSTFQPMANMLEKFEESYREIKAEADKEVTEELTKRSRRLRIDIGKVRIETEKVRKAEKEQYLRGGKAIDGVSNILKWAITDKEESLKKIERHFEEMEKERLAEVQREREYQLSEFVPDAHERDLSSMDDDVWAAYIATKKQEHADRLAAERKAEEERVAREKAEAEERERIRLENEQLKQEAAEREKREAAERKAREAKEAAEAKARRAKEAAEKKARLAAEAKREAELKKEREAHEVQLAKERAERERVEREVLAAKRDELEAKLKAKEAAERKARAEKEAAEKRAREEEEARQQAELSKSDGQKFDDMAAELRDLIRSYEFKSKANKELLGRLQAVIQEFLEQENL